VLALGGEQCARELEHEPWLAAEAEFLREAVTRDVPVLAVCLGAQLLAAALGARVERLPGRTVAWLELEPTAAGAADAVVGALPAPVAALHFNEDGFGLPPGAVELLSPGPSVSAFRAGGHAWGVQFHPDVDRATLDGWYALGWHEQAGVDEAAARAADARAWPRQEAQAEALFGAFAHVLSGAGGQAPSPRRCTT
jgi:GMP synthase (glutamine-hydrolysing)